MNIRSSLLWIALVALVAGLVPSASRAADADVVRLMFNPGLYDELPLMLAMDKGYFTEEHLDVRPQRTPARSGSSCRFSRAATSTSRRKS